VHFERDAVREGARRPELRAQACGNDANSAQKAI